MFPTFQAKADSKLYVFAGDSQHRSSESGSGSTGLPDGIGSGYLPESSSSRVLVLYLFIFSASAWPFIISQVEAPVPASDRHSPNTPVLRRAGASILKAAGGDSECLIASPENCCL